MRGQGGGNSIGSEGSRWVFQVHMDSFLGVLGAVMALRAQVRGSWAA
jgi:hypothetical protein